MENVFEAIVETDGRIKISSHVRLAKGARVFVSVPTEEPDSVISGVSLSERSLSADWLNSEEEAAWAHLQ